MEIAMLAAPYLLQSTLYIPLFRPFYLQKKNVFPINLLTLYI